MPPCWSCWMAKSKARIVQNQTDCKPERPECFAKKKAFLTEIGVHAQTDRWLNSDRTCKFATKRKNFLDSRGSKQPCYRIAIQMCLSTAICNTKKELWVKVPHILRPWKGRKAVSKACTHLCGKVADGPELIWRTTFFRRFPDRTLVAYYLMAAEIKPLRSENTAEKLWE